jgi:hypothetical protein
LRDGWIDYFGSQQVTKIMTKHAKAFALADKLAARFHVDYASAGAWKDDGSVRLLHALDIEFGRILLCKEGYQGTAEEIAATAGVFLMQGCAKRCRLRWRQSLAIRCQQLQYLVASPRNERNSIRRSPNSL